jgi:hypothetical protein
MRTFLDSHFRALLIAHTTAVCGLLGVVALMR